MSVHAQNKTIVARFLTEIADSDPAFVVIRFKVGNRCLTLGAKKVESTSTCEPTDPKHDTRWDRYKRFQAPSHQ